MSFVAVGMQQKSKQSDDGLSSVPWLKGHIGFMLQWEEYYIFMKYNNRPFKFQPNWAGRYTHHTAKATYFWLNRHPGTTYRYRDEMSGQDVSDSTEQVIDWWMISNIRFTVINQSSTTKCLKIHLYPQSLYKMAKVERNTQKSSISHS